MPDGTAVLCIAPESSASRTLRVGSLTCLMMISLAECGMAARMVAGVPSVANLAFLLFTLALCAAVVIYLRSRDQRALFVVQSAAAAALLSLFWAGQSGVTRGPSLTLGRSTYDLTLTLAGLLFVALLLGRLLRRSPVEQECRCG